MATSSSVVSEDQLHLGINKVLCDSCIEKKVEAVKYCLDCGASFCDPHLEPLKTTPQFMEHKLMVPMEKVKDYICQKHKTPLELFCRDDQTCVCRLCILDDHETHNTVPLEEESREKKTELEKTQEKVQRLIQNRLKRIDEIEQCVKDQTDLLKVMEEKQKAVELEAEEFIKKLDPEITELKRKNTELEQLLHTEDHLHLIKIYEDICTFDYKDKWSEITNNTFLRRAALKRALVQFQQIVHEEIDPIPDIASFGDTQRGEEADYCRRGGLEIWWK